MTISATGTSGRPAPAARPPSTDRGATEGTTEPWVSLTDLGRSLGLSAVTCGRMLIEAGLRDAGGRPTEEALRLGLARPGGQGLHRGRATLWQQKGCQAVLEDGASTRPGRPTLVEQWAELLWALKQGSPSISTSAEQMAEDLPRELVGAVNRQLQDKGWDFQVVTHPSRPQGSAQHHGIGDHPSGGAHHSQVSPGRSPRRRGTH